MALRETTGAQPAAQTGQDSMHELVAGHQTCTDNGRLTGGGTVVASGPPHCGSESQVLSLEAMARHTLGPAAAAVTSLVYVSMTYTLLLAYVAKAGDILSSHWDRWRAQLQALTRWRTATEGLAPQLHDPHWQLLAASNGAGGSMGVGISSNSSIAEQPLSYLMDSAPDLLSASSLDPLSPLLLPLSPAPEWLSSVADVLPGAITPWTAGGLFTLALGGIIYAGGTHHTDMINRALIAGLLCA